ncbi:methylcobamide:CoM methyltransferase MtaA [Methanococcoides methylutens]|uniref:Methylcobalamin:coenzyme M methyltransferase, methanol-specific n=1 Tax=Methanococcoides methylutens MM1 TaxID=1434104 RepID=A0A0E3X1E0_METMT|nr:methylcobamide:CoM methyltransferase MtaA [Methanococcoides methylutens]AKB86104.1 Methylcobalamin:coenzyme M methyltransferase, methanol-specific [Methanococcoides methylutens MM1]
MHDLNFKDRLLKVFNGEEVDKVPVGSFTTTPVMELMEKCGSARPEADHDPEKMATLAVSQHEIAGFEMVRFPFDCTILGEAMGCEIHCGTKERTPSVINGLLKTPLECLEVPHDLLERGRIPSILEAADIIRERIGEEVPIIAGLEGPMDLAVSLSDIRSFLLWTIKDPEKVSQLLDVCTEACIELGNAYLDHGVDVVCIADAVASPELVKPSDFEELIKPRYSRITKGINGLSVLHVCGKTDSIISHMTGCGFDGISIEESIQDLNTAVEVAHRNNTIVIGNVSTSVTMFSGTPEQVKEEAFKSLDAGVDILAPGCGLAPQTPIRNLKALIEARNKYCDKSYTI